MPEPLFAFTPGRRALVTGGASGLGMGTAMRRLAVGASGASVAVADLPRQIERLDDADRERFVALPMGVRDEASVRDGVASASSRLGGLDTLVNSAGVFQFQAIEAITTLEWDRILDVHLRGTFLAMREAMPHLKASGRGRVVNISSYAGKRGFALLGAYSASKFGVVGLTQAVAAEVAPDGVRVNAVCPGTIAETGMGALVIEQKIELGLGGSRDEVLTRGAAPFPLRRVGTVADAADTVMFLISESSGWITGESINIGGGSLAG